MVSLVWLTLSIQPRLGMASAPTTTLASSNCGGTVDLSSKFTSKFGVNTPDGNAASSGGSYDTVNKNQGGGFYYTCPTVNKNTNCVLTNMNGSGSTAAQKVNFANWYSYYRTRNLMTRSAIANVFGGLGSGIRVIWQTINAGNRVSGGTQTFSSFADTARTNFFKWLYTVPTKGGTDCARRGRGKPVPSSPTERA